jgi:hypothetical protein
MNRSPEYWAGLFDGEGCILIHSYQRKGCFRAQSSLKVSVSNTHYGIILALSQDFPPPSGRVIASFLGGPKDQVKRRQQYKWEMSGLHAYNFLKSVTPYLLIKREQAVVALEFYDLPWRTQRTGAGGGWKIRTDEQVIIDGNFAQRIKELKYAC